MLLQRLRNSNLLVGFRAFSASTPSDHRKPRKRKHPLPHQAFTPRLRQPGEKPTIPKYEPLSKVRDVFVASDFPDLYFFKLDDSHDRGIDGDTLKKFNGGAVKDGPIIDGLRKSNQLEAARNYIAHILTSRDKLAASALLEASKFFPLIAIHSKIRPEVDNKLIERLEQCVADLPKSILSDSARFYLSAGKSACSGFVDLVKLEEFDFRKLLFRKDCFAMLAHESLVLKDIERFKKVTELFPEISGAEIRANKYLLKYFCDFLKFSEPNPAAS